MPAAMSNAIFTRICSANGYSRTKQTVKQFCSTQTIRVTSVDLCKYVYKSPCSTNSITNARCFFVLCCVETSERTIIERMVSEYRVGGECEQTDDVRIAQSDHELNLSFEMAKVDHNTTARTTNITFSRSSNALLCGIRRTRPIRRRLAARRAPAIGLR